MTEILVHFGIYTTTPSTEWQHQVIKKLGGDRNSIFKAICLWKQEPTREYESFPGICRLWYEPTNPLDERSPTILMGALYFEDYNAVKQTFSQYELEEALNGFRVNSGKTSKNPKNLSSDDAIGDSYYCDDGPASEHYFPSPGQIARYKEEGLDTSRANGNWQPGDGPA